MVYVLQETIFSGQNRGKQHDRVKKEQSHFCGNQGNLKWSPLYDTFKRKISIIFIKEKVHKYIVGSVYLIKIRLPQHTFIYIGNNS